jgi:hypothetical protein
MRFGPIVDGQAEFFSLPELFPRIGSGHTILKPLRADIQPYSPVPRIVQAVKSRLHIHAGKDADVALILIDRESRAECAGAWARELESALYSGCEGCGIDKFAVVIKNRTFENWLISDPQAIGGIAGRFKLTTGQINTIAPNKADHIDAIEILRAAALKKSYDKVQDAVRILKVADPLVMASNSRSFRRLLRVIECAPYDTQSRRPL